MTWDGRALRRRLCKGQFRAGSPVIGHIQALAIVFITSMSSGCVLFPGYAGDAEFIDLPDGGFVNMVDRDVLESLSSAFDDFGFGGQHGVIVAICIQGVLDDIVAYAGDYVNEELSDKWIQSKTPACLRAVDNDGNHGIGEVLLPLCENRSVFAEQAKPDLCLLSTIARPVIPIIVDSA